MPICTNYSALALQYKNIVDTQNIIIQKQKDEILKLKNEIQAFKKLSISDYNFYLKDKKKNIIILNELDRILTKFNC